MTTEARIGSGTLLKIGDGAGSESFTTIAEVLNVNGPNITLDILDATHQSSGNWRDKIAGLLNAGPISFDVNFLPDNSTQSPSAGLISDMTSRTKRNFQLVWPDDSNTTLSFAAFVAGFNPTAPVDDKFMASVTMEITGSVTFS